MYITTLQGIKYVFSLEPVKTLPRVYARLNINIKPIYSDT